MKKNTIYQKQWFVLIISIFIVLLVSLLVFYILSYIIPFSKNTKGIENSSKAYYMAESWIEDSLYAIKNKDWYSSWTTFNNSQTWSSIKIIGSWSVLPPSWKWNSEYNEDYNIIKIWDPIQLKIWKWKISNWDNVKFTFRVPDLDGGWDISWNSETLSWTSNLNIINWKLVWNDDVLDASWSLVTVWQINWEVWYESVKIWKEIFSSTATYNNIWKQLSDSLSKNFNTFYDDNCKWTNSGCTLKMSVINNLISKSWNKLPYLEWKIDFNNNNVPLRYSIIESSWKSYWFKKDLEIKKWQQTIVEAADFTVIQ